MSNTTNTLRGEITWTTQTTHHEINVAFWESFEKDFGKIARRMEKKGFPVPTFQVAGADFVKSGKAEVMTDDGRQMVHATWLARPITITSAHLNMVGDFKVVGTMRTVSTDENGNPMNVVMKNPDFDGDIDAFRDHGMHCDHCGKNRRRKDVVILSSEEQGFVQVGKSCLQDFLGIDPALLFSNNFAKPEEWVEASTGGKAGDDFAITLDDLILATVIHRETNRWTPRCQGDVCSIADIHHIHWGLNRVKDADKATEAQIARAQRVKQILENHAFVVASKPESHNEFQFKVAGLVRQGFAVWKHANILAAGISTSIDWMDRKDGKIAAPAPKPAPVSGHFGNVGERDIFTLTFNTKFFTSEGGEFGTTFILKGTDAQGRKFTWFAKHNKFVEQFVSGGACNAGTIQVKATVKKHGSHPKFGDETVLTRVSPL